MSFLNRAGMLGLLLGLTAMSAQAEIRFDHISSADGLSSSWVRCFHQDPTGFIWIGTSDSLDRYDGREIKGFQPELENGRTIFTAINSVIDRDAHQFWVATNSGLFSFDTNTGTFTLFDQIGDRPVLDVIIDQSGRIWAAATDGLFLVEDERFESIQKFTTESEGEQSLPHGYVNSLYEDREGRIWVGTKDGLCLWNEDTRDFTIFDERSGAASLSSTDVLDVAGDRFGRIWMGTYGGGIEVLHDYVGPGSGRVDRVVSGKCIRLTVDAEDTVWAAMSGGGGLVRFDVGEALRPDDISVERFQRVLGDEWSLGEDSIFSVFEDREGDIWVGTYGDGVNYYCKRGKRFAVEEKGTVLGESISENSVTCFFEEDDYFWVGTMSGLERQRKSDGQFKQYRSVIGDETTLASDPIFVVYKDTRGNLWVGGWMTGLNRYDYETDTFERFLPSEDPGSIGGAVVFGLLEDSKGRLWVGTDGGGLCRFDYETEQFVRYRHAASDPGSLYDDHINDIIETRDGTIYLSVYRALERFDPESGTFEHIGHRSEFDNGNGGGDIQDVYEDSAGQIWLATNSGLELFNQETRQFRLFGTEDGLPSNNIQAVLDDGLGNLWVTSSKGLSVFVGGVEAPEYPVFRNMTERDGLSSTQFNIRSSYVGKDGLFYFGGSSGYTYFWPEEISFNETAPSVALTELSLLETSPDQQLAYRPIDLNVNSLESLELDYDEASFIVSFAALNYLTPENNRYRYQLEGYDTDWVDAGSSGMAAYTQLPPGRYTFRVLGSNNDGVWATKEKRLGVIVREPWWGTLWFRSTAVVVFGALLIAVYRVRFAILRKQRRVLEAKVKERTLELERANGELEDRQEEIASQNEELQRHREDLEEMISERTQELETAKAKAEESDRLKSNFLMNMSHEIRTPMNAIIGFSSLLRGNELSVAERDEFIDIISNNGQSLLVLIDDILDISMIQSDQLRLSEEVFQVRPLFVELRDFYRLKAKPGLEVNFEDNADLEGLKLYADPVRFRQVLNNLLSNAFKYTEAGRIRFRCSVNGNEALFEVLDTGLGIDEEDQKRIFENFFKVDKHSARLYPGTGIGLALCRKLVSKMGGELGVESTVGKGSRFYFTLPLGELPKVEGTVSNKSIRSVQIEGDVLVAEDEDMNFKVVELALKGTGVRVHRARDGGEAVSFVATHTELPLRLVLMDIKMPVLDGSQAHARIRELNPDLPVYAVTAHALPSDVERFRSEGFTGVMTKPINVDELIGLVESYCVSSDGLA